MESRNAPRDSHRQGFREAPQTHSPLTVSRGEGPPHSLAELSAVLVPFLPSGRGLRQSADRHRAPATNPLLAARIQPPNPAVEERFLGHAPLCRHRPGSRCPTRPPSVRSAICWSATLRGSGSLRSSGNTFRQTTPRSTQDPIVDTTIIGAPSSTKNKKTGDGIPKASDEEGEPMVL
jgi:hypothetical protein